MDEQQILSDLYNDLISKYYNLQSITNNKQIIIQSQQRELSKLRIEVKELRELKKDEITFHNLKKRFDEVQTKLLLYENKLK